MTATNPPDPTLRRDLVVLGGVALALRVPWLGAVPGVAGDEANWALYAHAVAQGVRVRLTPDAAFVTELYAHLLAPAVRLAGLSWAALRAVNVAAVVIACLGVRLLGARVAGPAAGRAMALVFALHPWSVLWSRTLSAPYALALCGLGLGSLALLAAHAGRSRALAFAGWQGLGLTLHFTPLGIPWITGCFLATARARWRPWWAVALGSLHALCIVRGALGVARTTAAASTPLPRGLFRALRMLVAQLTGASSVRHLAGLSLAQEIAGCLGLAALTVGAWRARREPAVRHAALALLAAVVATPVMLAPARQWSMPTIDADRYGVAVLAPLALLLGAMVASAARGARVTAWAFVAWLGYGTAVLGAHASRGGGGDLGLEVARGGGRYRGWQRPAAGGTLVDRAYEAVVRDARGAPAVIAYQDYALHAIRARTLTGDHRLRHRFGEPDPRPGERTYWLLWHDAAFAPGYAPGAFADAQKALRRRVIDAGSVLVADWRTPAGTPLAELRRSP